jgi:hypothetical protein
MIDFIDIFDVYHQVKGQADSDRRAAGTGDKLRELEQRCERMSLVTNALWQLLKSHTGLTDADLKKYMERVDLSDGVRDGKVARNKGAMDCPHCSRRVLKSATACAWCGGKLTSGDPFQST